MYIIVIYAVFTMLVCKSKIYNGNLRCFYYVCISEVLNPFTAEED